MYKRPQSFIKYLSSSGILAPYTHADTQYTHRRTETLFKQYQYNDGQFLYANINIFLQPAIRYAGYVRLRSTTEINYKIKSEEVKEFFHVFKKLCIKIFKENEHDISYPQITNANCIQYSSFFRILDTDVEKEANNIIDITTKLVIFNAIEAFYEAASYFPLIKDITLASEYCDIQLKRND